jgi:hypothetical protein
MLAAASLALSACVPPVGFACPAIDYGRTVRITLTDPRPDLHLLLCNGEGCMPPATEGPQSAGPAPPRDTVVTTRGDSVGGWTAEPIGYGPAFGYRLRDAAGVVVAQGEIAVEWVRVGGTERCGGPLEADVVLPAP